MTKSLSENEDGDSALCGCNYHSILLVPDGFNWKQVMVT